MDRLPLSPRSRHVPLPLGTPFNFLRINSAPFVYQQSPTKVRYECLCARCNQTTVVRFSHLKITKSCGCLTKRNGPRTCRVCGVKESVDKPFPSNRFLLCKKHELEHNRHIRERSHKKWVQSRNHSPEKFLAFLMNYIKQRGKSKPHKSGALRLSEVLEIYHKQGGRCAITGVQMACDHLSPYAISIDRRDSAIGYTAHNIQLVCRCVNLAKNSYTNEDILDFFDACYRARASAKESS